MASLHRAMENARQLFARWGNPSTGDYSRFVRLMKVVLPSLAVVLLSLVVLWARMAPQVESFKVGFAKVDAESVKTLSMLNARYFGIDENNKPYSVTSDRASQATGQADAIDLENPKADFASRSGAGVVVLADHGRFYQKEQKLELLGNVSLYHEQGYELHTQQAFIDLKNNNAFGNAPIDGQGPQGHMEGEGFRISDRGDKVLVTGRSSLSVKGADKTVKKKGTQP